MGLKALSIEMGKRAGSSGCFHAHAVAVSLFPSYLPAKESCYIFPHVKRPELEQ